MTGYENAIDEIRGLIWQAWQANTAGIVGYVPELRWADKEYPALPDSTKYWGRVATQEVASPQSSLSASVGSEGKRQYTTYGLVTIQLFFPRTDTQAGQIGRKMAEMAKNILRGKRTTNGVIFRNPRINELSPETSWHRTNIIAEYEYSEVY